MNKFIMNSIISILFIFSISLTAKTISPMEQDIDENSFLENLDTNSLLKDWNDYQINYNKSQIDKSTKIDFEDNNSIIEQPECSIIRNN